jgi:hypothetical protein
VYFYFGTFRTLAADRRCSGDEFGVSNNLQVRAHTSALNHSDTEICWASAARLIVFRSAGQTFV